MKFNYSKLNGRIVEICGTQSEFARRMNKSEKCISNKLQQKIPFKQNEIENALVILGIDKKDIGLYFFDKQVQNI